MGDSFRPTEEALRYYEVKHAIVRNLQPKSICEIGVRAGYSAYAFLTAAPGAEFLGIDKGAGDPAEVAVFEVHAQKILAGFNFRLWPQDSQELQVLPYGFQGPFEFVHVDGDHSYTGCRHDVELALIKARWVLVDDFDVGPEIRRACHDVLLADRHIMAEYIPDGFRGNLLLSRNVSSARVSTPV